MSSIRSTIAALNDGIQGLVKGSGTVLGGAADRLAKYLQAENEIFDRNVVIDIDQRTKTRVVEFYEFENMLLEKHGNEGIERINELSAAFEEKAKKRLEKSE